MEQKKQKLLEKLKELKAQAVYALEGDEPLFAVDTNEMMDLIELAFQIFDAERKPGFTLRREDGTSETVESDCFSFLCVDDHESGTTYNAIHGTNGDLLGLIELHEKNQKRLLGIVAKELRKDI